MKNNKLVIENGDTCEKYDILLNVELNNNNYVIYTKREQNEYGDVIAYAGNYEFLDGVQSIKPIDDEKILQLPDFKEKNQPEKSLEKTELREEIDIALNMISEEHRKVVILRDVAGMKYSDIAKALSIEEGTVKSRIARARSALRKILIDRGNISLPSSSKQSERRREDAKLWKISWALLSKHW